MTDRPEEPAQREPMGFVEFLVRGPLVLWAFLVMAVVGWLTIALIEGGGWLGWGYAVSCTGVVASILVLRWLYKRERGSGSSQRP